MKLLPNDVQKYIKQKIYFFVTKLNKKTRTIF